jgi:hypothetical protein
MNSVLFVAWRAGDESRGRWGPVGRLERTDEGYRFTYTQGAKMLEGFRPFPGMPDLERVYESDELFPLFSNRLLGRSRPEYEAFLRWGGFDPDNPPDPIALLGVMEGRRETDSIEVFPCPAPDAEGRYVAKFFLHGVRWMGSEAWERISRLQPGDPLYLMLDVMNPYDKNAVAVRTGGAQEQGRVLIGYVPRYLAPDICKLCQLCDPASIELTVHRVNNDAPMQHWVLCQMKACWPEDFHPCSGREFQPLVQLPLLEFRGSDDEYGRTGGVSVAAGCSDNFR